MQTSHDKVSDVLQKDDAVSPKLALVHEALYTDDAAFTSGTTSIMLRQSGVEHAAYKDDAVSPKLALVHEFAWSEEVVAEFAVVKRDIFGNEISNQKRTGGWS